MNGLSEAMIAIRTKVLMINDYSWIAMLDCPY